VMDKKIQLKHSEDYYVKVLLKQTKLKEIMTKPPISIKIDEPFSKVPKKMRAYQIRHLPVVDKDNKVVGLITQRDLFKICPPHKIIDGTWHYHDEMLDKFILAKVMVKNPFSMSTEHSVGDALVNIANKKYGCVPIVDKKGVLCGIITQIDILKISAQIYKE